MDQEILDRLEKITRLEDELHYLQNIVEYCDNEDITLEAAVHNKIADLYAEIEKLERGE